MKTAAKFTPDVLVCGGGCAGLVAAVAAARNNARTLLVERAPFAGGIITTVGLPFFDGVADKRTGRIVVRGIALELLVKMGRAKPDQTHIRPHNPTIDSTERFKLLADQLLTDHGQMLQVLYHSSVCAVERRGERIRAVLVANKDGLVRIEPRVVIDCTGDADVAYWAEVPCRQQPELMPMTLHFRIGNVRRHPRLNQLARQALQRAHAQGKLPMFYGPGLIFCFARDEAYVHAVRVPGNATDAADLTRAEMQGRADAWTMFQQWKKEVPGFEDSYFITSGPYIGIRETRRVVGRYTITAEDIRRGRRFADAVVTGCWYLDRHPNTTTVGTANDPDNQGFQPDPYDIPYRTLVASQVENLLVAGRCHSATAEAASSTRVSVTAMGMGQAAGTAAALAVHSKTTVAELDGQQVRQVLESQGAGPFTDE